MPLFIHLLYQDNVHQLIRVHHLFNETNFNQFIQLLSDGFLVLQSETPLLSFDWAMSWLHPQVMGHYLWIDPKHVCG